MTKRKTQTNIKEVPNIYLDNHTKIWGQKDGITDYRAVGVVEEAGVQLKSELVELYVSRHHTAFSAGLRRDYKKHTNRAIRCV